MSSIPTRKVHAPATTGGGTRGLPAWVLSVLCISAAAYAGLFVDGITAANAELLQALTIAPIIVGLTLPLAFRIARTERDPVFAGIVMAGLAAKLVTGYVRFYVGFVVYGGRIDATQYHLDAAPLARDFRQFIFTNNIGSLVGTGFIKFLTAIIYAFTGVSRIGGFLVYAWLGFLGLLLLTRAFAIGVPGGSSRRYTIAVLFLPSLIYWPAAIGKEAWMLLGIGLCAYGIANVFQGRAVGAIALVPGVLATLVVRPHIGLLIFTGLVFALLVRRAPARTFAAPLFRILGLAVLLVMGLFLASQTASFLGQPSLTLDSVNAELTTTEGQTGDGGSAFTPVRVRTPIDIVPAFVTVFFRPFPFEASNVQGLLTAAECVLLLGLLWTSRRRLRSIPRLMRTTPYVAFSIAYLFAFVYAFSSFANFGILARQRTQALPFLLVLIAIPSYDTLIGDETAAPEIEAAPEPHPDIPSGGRRRRSRPVAAPRTRTPVSSGSSFQPPARAPS